MAQYNIIAEDPESTIVAEYEFEYKRSGVYQSEAQLEKEFIRMLGEQGYDYLAIHNEQDLVANLREQLERLNNYTFTDKEWERLFTTELANKNEGIVEKTARLQASRGNAVVNIKLDNGFSKNITLLDKRNIHNNSLQVINQYEETEGKHDTRYDVTVLVNGFPMVHIELKRRGVNIKEAFNQINRYQRDSFWAGCGLYEYIQVFVISNGTFTKYYSNSTRENRIKEAGQTIKGKKKTSNSFEFTSYWADGNNKTIVDIIDFTKTFFAKHSILNILTKYCVFTSEQQLMVMRPYQIAATERILNRIKTAYNYKHYGTVQGGGFVWHTTGSGKTLTSFKTAQLATDLDFIDKVVFVVDRKDLDYQTMKEYDRFEKDAANSNTSTAVLKRQLEDANARIIITTIQKLAKFVNTNPKHPIYTKQCVIIFDECHRSQFGAMHVDITKNFKHYYIFGFTGTPIFAVNTQNGGKLFTKTTEQVFGDKLHTYTIVNAINDGNVLPFKIEYLCTIKRKSDIADKQVHAIDIEKALHSQQRITEVTKYILEQFDLKTMRTTTYQHRVILNAQEVASAHRGKVEEKKDVRSVFGYNAMFCVDAIPTAIQYYQEIKKQQADKPEESRLKVAMIYSYSPNEAEEDFLDDENNESTDGLDKSSRDHLESAIQDYNAMFQTNYDTSGDRFQNYYRDLSMRMKNKEVDLLIVVNMFLTGFDATTLNTLFVDKNLKYHGLIQAFSRTNRILNSQKTFGNIVCFRDLQQQTDDAISLFGDKDAHSIVLLRSYLDYYKGFVDNKGKHQMGYAEIVEQLQQKYPLPFDGKLVGEDGMCEYIKLFNAYLRSYNVLSTFDQFDGDEILTEGDVQDYKSVYLEFKDRLPQPDKHEKEDIIGDLEFEMELIRMVDINIDYILMLVRKYHEDHCVDKEILVSIQKALSSSPQLRSKKQLIDSFIDSLNGNSDVDVDWQKHLTAMKEQDLAAIIEDENLKENETRQFIESSFRTGELRTTGTDVDKILPAMSRFGGGNRSEKKQTVIDKLKKFFEKYFGLF